MITLSLIIAVVGLVMFLLPRGNSDVKRIGEIVFFCGLLTWLMAVGSHTLY